MSNHILALDLETTGLPEDNPSVIEIGCVHYNGEERVSEFSVKFQPDWDKNISIGALRVNKTDLEALALREAARTGAIKFINYLVHDVFPITGSKQIKILGQNVAFDVTLLKEYLKHHKVNGWQYIFNHGVIDTSGMGNALRDAGILEMDKMSLENLAGALKLDVKKELLHTGLYDAELSARCYFAILKLLRDLKHGKN